MKATCGPGIRVAGPPAGYNRHGRAYSAPVVTLEVGIWHRPRKTANKAQLDNRIGQSHKDVGAFATERQLSLIFWACGIPVLNEKFLDNRRNTGPSLSAERPGKSPERFSRGSEGRQRRAEKTPAIREALSLKRFKQKRTSGDDGQGLE